MYDMLLYRRSSTQSRMRNLGIRLGTDIDLVMSLDRDIAFCVEPPESWKGAQAHLDSLLQADRPMMETYVQVVDQSEPSLIFHYGPFETSNEAHKAAEKFKKTIKRIRGIKVTLTSWRSDQPRPAFVFPPNMLGTPRPME
jgi:hypothetical protein